MKDISIVIVNWNTEGLLKNCLKSIAETVDVVSYETIVVDNASFDRSLQMLAECFPQVKVIANKTNRGFAAANNQAFRIMEGRYALLLNTDTVVTPGAVQRLFNFMESHPEAAIAGAQLLNADGTKQDSIAPFPGPLTLLTNETLLEYLLPKRFPSKRKVYDKPIPVDSVIGACMMVRKEAMDLVGIFDERYFFFFEETDWARQMHQAGWKVYHVPDALVYHLQGKSIGHELRSRQLFYRSRYQYFRKWSGRSGFLFISVLIFGRLLVNWLLTAAANVLLLGTQKKLRQKWLLYSRLILWHLRGCP